MERGYSLKAEMKAELLLVLTAFPETFPLPILVVLLDCLHFPVLPPPEVYGYSASVSKPAPLT